MSDDDTFTLVSAITVLFMFDAQGSSPPKFVTMLSRRSQSIGSARAYRYGHGRPVVDCRNCGCRRRFPSIFPHCHSDGHTPHIDRLDTQKVEKTPVVEPCVQGDGIGTLGSCTTCPRR